MTVAIVLLSLTVSVAFGWAVVGGIIRPAKARGGVGPRPSSDRHRTTVPRERPAQPRVLHDGAWVGALERLAIAGAVLTRQPEMVAVVVVAKGLGR